jgi:hypothetical protein
MNPTIESLDALLSQIIEKAQDLSGKSDLALIDDLMKLDNYEEKEEGYGSGRTI